MDKLRIKENSKLIPHIVAWIIIFLLPYLFTSAYDDDSNNEFHSHSTFLYLDTVTKIFWVVLFYLNSEILVRRLVYEKKYLLFAISNALLFSLIMLVHGIFFEILINGRQFSFLTSSSHNIIIFSCTIIASIAYRTIDDRTKSEKEISERTKENLKTELSFLRSQISPHFLFNILNNIAAMARLRDEQLEPTIHKLSALIQYMLYETDEEKVILKSEIEYLQSYIELQQQRFSEKLKLDVCLEVKDNWHAIEPMLLIPFVENAFKHGTGLVQAPEIGINLRVENDQLFFGVKNKYVQTETTKDKTSGIGLSNVRRRLELLYGSDHNLSVTKDGKWFSISLQLTFKP